MLASLRARTGRRRFLADPFRRYLVTMLVLMGIPVLVLSWVLGSVIVQRLSDHMLQVAGAEVQSFVEGLLPASPTGGVPSAPNPTNTGWWQSFGQRIMRNPTTIAVRVYDQNGRIVFANNPDLIDMKPSASEALSRALTGKRSSRLERSFLSPIERRLTSLVPVRFGPGAGNGAIEVVQDVRSLQQELRLARWLIVGAVLLLVALFLAALVPIARRIARSAYVDPLTRLPNRRYLAELAGAVLRPREVGSAPVALVLIDLDRFRVVNDTLGHRVGDRLLRSVAERLQAEVRAGDYVVRHGGDEFALVLLGTDRTAAHAAASRISKALELPVEMGRQSVRPNASLGLALHPQDGDSLDILLQHAEIAMYRAKSAKVPFEFYREDLNPYSREGLFLESELREAISGHGLELVFQPIRDLVDDRLVGAEALVRWHHPRHGIMNPGAFIALAEDTGLIRQLDRWALDQAAAQLAAWHASGRRLYVSVNLSAQTTMDRGLLDDLARALEDTAAPPEYLLLEVTERSAIDDMESSANILESARSMGVRIALDDFGKGYSSLATLDRLPIGYLKIDQDFVKGIGQRSKDEHLIRAIAGFSRGIGIPIVAEGIETQEQLRWLRREGVRLGQGYLLARPSPAALIEAERDDPTEVAPV